MQRALLIGVVDDDTKRKFGAVPSLDAMADLLRDLGGWSIERLDGSQASRANILEALDQLEKTVGREDSVLFYFSGHGGVVEIADLSPPLGGRLVFYLAAARRVEEFPFQGILDIELSLALGRMDRVCENVTAILDCCYSARIVRGPSWVLYESPAWLRTLAERLPERGCEDLLHPTMHPRIVRLAGASSLGRSFADRSAVGRLTGAFIDVVREAQLRIDRLTWDTLAHRAREQAIARLGCEEQWVTLAGPRQRLLFSRRAAPLSRTVGFVPDECGGGGWIRAGAMQGVRVGDEWGLSELTLDDQLCPRICERVRVTAIDLNRAAVEPIEGMAIRAPYGASAHPCGEVDAARVLLDVAAGCSRAKQPIVAKLMSDRAEHERWRVGDRLCVVVECPSQRDSWFVNVIMIDVAGCLALLDPAEPDGRELWPGRREKIGEHRLRWVEGVARRPHLVHVIVLASRRPIQLGHLVGIPRDRPPRRRARLRGHASQPRPRRGPELSHEWGAVHLPFELDPGEA